MAAIDAYKSKSPYFQTFFNGQNEDEASAISNLLSSCHSRKIKSANQLEDFIYHIVQQNTQYNTYTSINPLHTHIALPAFIHKCKLHKDDYEKHKIICKNKKLIEIDFVIINEDNVHIVEFKNGCDFDTKKSKGEVQSLEATKRLFEFNGFTNVQAYICCYDATKHTDIKIKTHLGNIQTILYEQFETISNMHNCNTRSSINNLRQSGNNDNIIFFKQQCQKICAPQLQQLQMIVQLQKQQIQQLQLQVQQYTQQ